jgi:hypothetical protein
MRTLIAVALLFSAQAFACPELAGTYTCTFSDGTEETGTVTQSVVNGINIYNYNGTEIRADGVTYPVPEDETLKEGTSRAWCDDPLTLKGEVIGKYYSGGSYFGEVVLNLEFSKVGTSLRQVTTGNLKNSGGDYPINSDITCTAN